MHRDGSPSFDSRAWSALLVAALTVLGLVIRLRVVGQSLFADELSSYWVVAGRGLGDVISTVHSNAEITPPLYFVSAWLTTQIHLGGELLRLPSLIAGTMAIPAAYLLGLRTAERAAGFVAAALTALSPFMIFYSTEARGYALAMTLVMLSTVAMLAAVDGGGIRAWVAYGLCSCAAVYTHYTAVFVLAAQLGWLLWAHPVARRPALLANAGAVVGFLPWRTGLANDLSSPTTSILSQLEPFRFDNVRISLEHWSVGYPYAYPTTTVGALPGVAALVLLGLGLGVAAGVAGVTYRRLGGPRTPRPARAHRRLVLIVGLALAAPVGEALVSAVGTNLLGTRNLAVSWPWLAVALAALVAATGRRMRFLTAGLVVASFAIGATKMLETRFQRPDERGVAHFIDREATPGDVVIDGVVLSPGPLSGFELSLSRNVRVFRAGQPEERDHPFGFGDRVSPIPDVSRRAALAARGRRIFLVSHEVLHGDGPAPRNALIDQVVRALPAGYRRVEAAAYPGIIRLTVSVYARVAQPRS